MNLKCLSSIKTNRLNVPSAAQKGRQKKCLHSDSRSDISSNHRPAGQNRRARVAVLQIVQAADPEALSRADESSYEHVHRDSLVQRVLKLIVAERLINENDRIVLGISGGVDSTVLLNLLLMIRRTIPFKIALAHLNHQLRGTESARDEEFVRRLSKKLQIPLFVKRADIKKFAMERHLSLQHAGREARYEFFDNILKEHGYTRIAVAHNLDDQIETFLLRAIKGSGLRGLSAIPIKRGAIIRPLLFTYRTEIEEYARLHGITFVEDSSNKKTIYERNFLRKEIIPKMARLNPRVKEKLFFLLNELSQVNRIFEDEAQSFYEKNVSKENDGFVFEVDGLKLINDEVKYRVISAAISSLSSTTILLREHFRQLNRIIDGRKPNVALSLPGGIQAKRVYNRFIIAHKSPLPHVLETRSLSPGRNCLESFGLEIQLSYSRRPADLKSTHSNVAYLDSSKLDKLTIRTFVNGDRFIPLGMKKMVKLKDFFMAMKIPLEQRRRIPLMCSDGEIAWIIGVRIDDRFKITEETGNVLKVITKPLSSRC